MIDTQNNFDMRGIDSAISKAGVSYYKLLLLAGKSGAGKTALLHHISQKMELPLINLGLSLSQRLLSLTVRQRKLKIADIIEDILDEQDAPSIGVDNTEIIFEPSLKISTLGLLKNISRNRSIIWTWNGDVEGDHLTYAYSGHPEYQRVSAKEFTVIAV
jgi:adenylate kinase family enzyme